MYTRRYDDSRGNIKPPENYSGNAFDRGTAKTNYSEEMDNSMDSSVGGNVRSEDRSNIQDGFESTVNSSPVQPSQINESMLNERTCAVGGCPYEQGRLHEDNDCRERQELHREDDDYREHRELHRDEKEHKTDSGLLSGILNRFRHLEFDDLLLLGLIILLWTGRDEEGCDNSDDLLLILGLLFITGI